MAMRKRRRLQDAYRFPGFQPLATARGVFGDPQVRIAQLVRRHAPTGPVPTSTQPHRVAWLVTGPRRPRPVFNARNRQICRRG
jgi:hypothetical protein